MKTIILAGFGILATGLIQAQTIRQSAGRYRAVIENQGELRISITGPGGTYRWTCRAIDRLEDVFLSREGAVAISGETTSDPVLLVAIHGMREKHGECNSGQLFDDEQNRTGMGRLPLHPQDRFPDRNPLTRASGAPPIVRIGVTTLSGWDREGNLHGIIRAFESHWREPVPVTIPYVWKVPKASARRKLARHGAGGERVLRSALSGGQ